MDFLDTKRKYRINESIKFPLGDSIMIVPIQAEVPDFTNVVCLEGTAQVMWSIIEECTSMATVTKMLLTKYSVDEDTLSKDINGVVEVLAAKNIIDFYDDGERAL